MNDKLLVKVERLARHANETHQQELRRKSQVGLKLATKTLRRLLTDETPKTTTLAQFYQTVDKTAIERALQDCEALNQGDYAGFLAALDSRYTYLRKYTSASFELHFAASPGSEELLKAIQIIRTLNKNQSSYLPKKAPLQCIPYKWRTRLTDNPKRRDWELAVYFAVKKALKAGNLYIAESRRHQYLWKLLYPHEEWQAIRPEAYANLKLPNAFDEIQLKLQQEFKQSVNMAPCAMDKEIFAIIRPKVEL
jgi:hypothetical protein